MRFTDMIKYDQIERGGTRREEPLLPNKLKNEERQVKFEKDQPPEQSIGTFDAFSAKSIVKSLRI